MQMGKPINSLQEYHDQYRQSVENPEAFWADQAKDFVWDKPWSAVLKSDMINGHNKWFVDGRVNITINCLDRHLPSKGDQTALLWEPNEISGQVRRLSYTELHEAVCRFANGLKTLGIRKGDRICFYMPMVPELMVGVLACARIGAVHSVVFAGFSSSALADRINDASCSTIICSDYNCRGTKNIPVKQVVDEAIEKGCPSVKNVVVYQHTGGDVNWVEQRDSWWHELVTDQASFCEPEVMDSEDPLFILYTSGSTGKPKGVVHTIGGYMVYTAYSFKNVFQYAPGDVYWCTADIGWITGHSYIIYGPLLNGATTMMFEGVPTYPDASRFWKICEKHKVNIFYTAPTAIRALMAAGDAFVKGHDLSALKVIGSVGEPINEEAWHWYDEHIGRGKAPIVDTWWQTETGGIMISPLPNITDTKPCYASYPLPGIQMALVDQEGKEIEGNGVEGLLCVKHPWPSMIRTTYGDHQRCVQTYFSMFPGMYFTGDQARRDPQGRYRVIGRVDDVINVSGHRIGTAEVENGIDEHDNVVESAVVGYPHPIKGQGIFAFIIVLDDVPDEAVFQKEINWKLTEMIGPIAKTDQVMIVSGLPKTRSGKIMRRLLRKAAAGEYDQLGDTSTLLNPEVVEEIILKSQKIHKA